MKPRSEEKRMWLFSDMSLSTATALGTIANWGLLLSLLTGIVSTFFVVQTTDVKERHWDEARDRSTERIVEISAEGEKAKAALGIAQADIVKASVQIAEARARTIEAELKLEGLREKNLELEKSIAPRMIEQAQASENLKPFAGTQYAIFFTPDAESRRMAAQIRALLSMAGWKKSQNPPLPPSFFLDGIRIDWAASPGDRLSMVAGTLAEQIKVSDVAAKAGRPVPEFEPDTIRISVGLKPIKIHPPDNLPSVNPAAIPGLTGLKSWGSMLFDKDE
jgi:hypothetical protein